MTLSRIVVTGASGFLGRHLLGAIQERYVIHGLARRNQRESGAPEHPNIAWHQVDIGDRDHLEEVFERILRTGPIEQVLHFAAHYDFTGDEDAEYWRTNVDGLRNVLELCSGLHLQRFVFASSVAACGFPRPGSALSEQSEADGDHIYARTKRIGETMLREYRDTLPAAIVRFGAMFSDFCEYPPLYMFIDTWLSRAWNRRILAGRGRSAIPYIHVRDAVVFFESLLRKSTELEPCEVLICSCSETVSHAELFDAVNRAYRGRAVPPLCVPRPLCRVGLVVRDLFGRTIGHRPFERPWMGKYIDLNLAVDASATYRRLGWRPKARLGILRRMPFLIEKYKTNPGEWIRLNNAAMTVVPMRPNLKVYNLLERHERHINTVMLKALQGRNAQHWTQLYHELKQEDLQWNIVQLLRHLMNAVRTRERALFMAYCRDLAQLRFMQGFTCEEVCNAIQATHDACISILRADPASGGLDQALYDYVTMTFHLGIDEMQDMFEELSCGRVLPDKVMLPKAIEP
ncbi:MAG: NAD-dependent epimerase/dehydratase family protein [Myxococcota bacterium]